MYPLTRNALDRYQPLAGLFEDFLRPALVWESNPEAPTIRVDVREAADAYTVQAEMPGIRKEDIRIEIEGNEVTISAEARRESEAKEGEKVLRAERFYGKTARRFALPQDLDEARAAAKFADGVLALTLPKKEAVKGRTVAVQ